MAGGVVGIVLGLGSARVVASRLGWAFGTRIDTMLLAFGFSALVGVVFGLYPARKASRLEPIDALRYE
jgi:putative ABC transport system permease protein